ncbi:hypothetical protein SEA_WEASELS2_126 [Rhodococcus phage Weasels2]|uniref:Uncharacterized protein n=1 Tax=Rhodococcus phage Weasels2 TaxID=1897437 RepID=A0A1I9SAA6_9CAUD|nr:hypothetical protein FDH04_gp283 [Rhodococcus phage Weasels2]AOZ63712.1 hypothetical protein SEA_WEASELS2_126 [Rhodococcus phage Weasels2]
MDDTFDFPEALMKYQPEKMKGWIVTKELIDGIVKEVWTAEEGSEADDWLRDILSRDRSQAKPYVRKTKRKTDDSV